MGKTLRIATIGVADDYPRSLVPLTLKALGYDVTWTQRDQAELVIYGPFQRPDSHQDRYVPKPLRPLLKRFRSRTSSGQQAVTLFQTGENLRHDHVAADFAISFDLAIAGNRHLRLPYWMEQLDWTHEGVVGTRNARFGQLLDIRRLMQPLGNAFLSRPRKAAFFSSHLREPRHTLYAALQALVKVDGFGSQFDATIAHHSASSIEKMNILRDYAFNLCPENSMYPGYYTEKIPEAFHAECLPIGWVDSNVKADFNPDAFINLAPMTQSGFCELASLLQNDVALQQYAAQPLLTQTPSLDALKTFLLEIVATVKT
jgi:Glycosyltransferase family 10 (fucosyltransferase) C-term/Alpha-(1,3)-fucosyltransferase FucT N-terminal domain